MRIEISNEQAISGMCDRCLGVPQAIETRVANCKASLWSLMLEARPEERTRRRENIGAGSKLTCEMFMTFFSLTEPDPNDLLGPLSDPRSSRPSDALLLRPSTKLEVAVGGLDGVGVDGFELLRGAESAAGK